ncbi:hypothetical protein QE152_g4677 [Popillia japonica]|uniref:Uncharacterized protein n=1 Tax=Popillia japonica TaxID=7064 RepID=A0AAW1N0A9_POPJA
MDDHVPIRDEFDNHMRWQSRKNLAGVFEPVSVPVLVGKVFFPGPPVSIGVNFRLGGGVCTMRRCFAYLKFKRHPSRDVRPLAEHRDMLV